MNNVLVTYFSASGVTKKLAQNIAKVLKSDIYEIKPEVPYTNEDLNWMNKQSRSSIEMSDKSSRPKIVNKNLDINNYDVIFLGFPIWWYIAPTIINTFLESYDFSNKTIILFATSGGSNFGKTVENLKSSVSSTTIIKEGKVLSSNISQEEILNWLKTYKEISF